MQSADRLIECEVIARRASYIAKGYPAVQVSTLRTWLWRAAEDGVDSRRIYEIIYIDWHTRWPLFPDLATMAGSDRM